MHITQPDDHNAVPSEVADLTLLHGSQDTWRAAGVNLYVLFLPSSSIASSPTSTRKRMSTHIAGIFVRMRKASTTSTKTRMPLVANCVQLAPSSQRFWCGMRHIEGWAFHQVALRTVEEQRRAILPEVDLQKLPILLSQMLDAAHTQVSSTSRGIVGYLVIHVKEVKPPIVRSNHLDRAKRDLRPDFRAALDTFDPLQLGEPRGYYRHYDVNTKQRGYLIVGRRAALLADISDESFTTLALLLQGGALAPQGGFTRESFTTVLTRVAQWDANQDVLETVDRLFNLKMSTDAATAGQIWLSYALALIGVSLSLITFISSPLWITPGLVLLGLSCLAHARYAQKGSQSWSITGKIFFLLGILAVAAGFLLGVLFPPTVLHFAMYLLR